MGNPCENCIALFDCSGCKFTTMQQENAALKPERDQNQTYADIYKDICDKYGENFLTLLEKAKGLQAERDELKKDCEDINKENLNSNDQPSGKIRCIK